MHRLACAVLLLATVSLAATNQPKSDPTAISLAKGSIAALTGGVAIGDVTLNGTATSVLGSDNKTGSIAMVAKGATESRVDLNLPEEIRSDVRNSTGGVASGAWKKDNADAVPYASHNCRTDASWFFPALSSLSQTANPNLVFQYIGKEQHRGINTQHIRVFQPESVTLLQELTTIDFYLDPASLLPLAVSFSVHPDLDASNNIPVEVLFANYQTVNGIPVPFSIQRLLNNSVVLDISITGAVFNTGLQSSLFTLQ